MFNTIDVDFFYGLGSRYSYLASTRIAALEADTACTVRWRPLKPGSLSRLRGASPFAGEPLSGQYEWPYRRYDAECWAEYYGVPYNEPADPTAVSSIPAIACVAAGRFGKIVDFSHSMFRAHFVEGLSIDEEACVTRAEHLGLNATEFLAPFKDPVLEEQLEAEAREAHGRGAFGVPTFFAGERMFWGNDRLPLLRHLLLQNGIVG